jgi:hypothetical protein
VALDTLKLGSGMTKISIIKFTIQRLNQRKKAISLSKQSQEPTGFTSWYSSIPFQIFLIAPKIYWLVFWSLGVCRIQELE